jgi:DNA-binding Lrp family transcriptional regulator
VVGPTRPASVPAVITSFVLIDAEPAAVAELAQTLAELPDVAEVYSVAGEVDLVAVVRVRRYEDLEPVVTGHIGRLPGITRTRTMLAFRSYSRRDLAALWDLGTD